MGDRQHSGCDGDGGLTKMEKEMGEKKGRDGIIVTLGWATVLWSRNGNNTVRPLLTSQIQVL